MRNEEHGASGEDFVSEVLRRLAERGRIYERYELEGRVAHGGQGDVLRAWDGDLHRTLAMKVIRTRDGQETPGSPSVDTRSLGRFLEEAQVTAQLDHPGIVPVHELGLDDRGRVYFTMKLVKGDNLKVVFERVHEGGDGWNPTRALRTLLKVCEATAYAHAKGVIHRDLKPSNVMVGKYGEVYVMDWGLARVLDREDEKDIRIREDVSEDLTTERKEAHGSGHVSPLITMDGDVIGTPAYMSPEQAAGDLAAMGPHSDVYSVGAMLYHLLTGRVPYVAPGSRPGNFAILQRVQAGAPEPVRELAPSTPVELVAICEKAMARDPSRRFPDMQHLAAELEAYLEHRPVPAHAPGLLHVLRLAARRNRPVVLTVGAAAVLVIVLASVFIARLATANRISLRRADVLEAAALIDEEGELYPALPSEVPRMERWLARVEDVHSREARYAAEAGESSLPDDLETLHVLRERVLDRIALAAELEALRADEVAWSAACADVGATDVYQGLVLEPQLGLLPLGRNEESGLWEFWHYASGEKPDVLDAGLGLLDVRPETAIVLVLVPPEDGAGAFFLGKYEVTQSQFERVMGFNPSKYDEERARRAGLEASPIHPVESVSWFDAHEFGRRLALTLPTEAQWERGCRAGTTMRLAWGDDWPALEGVENVRDQSMGVAYKERAPWNDGFPVHAPVGTFVPNAFGLYDMHGNVAEWCRDVHPDSPIQGVDPSDAGQTERRVLLMAFRGGSWYLELGYHDSGLSQNDTAVALNHARGFRVARGLDGGPD